MIIFRPSIYKWSFSFELSIGSFLERLVLKNDAECASQRLKWTFGARVMTTEGGPKTRLTAQKFHPR